MLASECEGSPGVVVCITDILSACRQESPDAVPCIDIVARYLMDTGPCSLYKTMHMRSGLRLL